MPAIAEIKALIEELAPPALAEDWDNVGVLVDCGGEITHVLVSLDITAEVVAEAEAQGCQLIVAHHPVIFRPLRRVVHGEVVYRLIKKSISALCAHSNLDAAAGGVNDILAAIFGIVEPAPFFGGMGRVGRLYQPATARQLADKFVQKFGAHVRLADAGRQVNTLAVVGGSGGGLLDEVLAAGADCILTGEADHHDAIDALQAGISLIVGGHYSTEFPVVPVLADRLAARLPSLKVSITRRNKDPFVYVP